MASSKTKPTRRSALLTHGPLPGPVTEMVADTGSAADRTALARNPWQSTAASLTMIPHLTAKDRIELLDARRDPTVAAALIAAGERRKSVLEKLLEHHVLDPATQAELVALRLDPDTVSTLLRRAWVYPAVVASIAGRADGVTALRWLSTAAAALDADALHDATTRVLTRATEKDCYGDALNICAEVLHLYPAARRAALELLSPAATIALAMIPLDPDEQAAVASVARRARWERSLPRRILVELLQNPATSAPVRAELWASSDELRTAARRAKAPAPGSPLAIGTRLRAVTDRDVIDLALLSSASWHHLADLVDHPVVLADDELARRLALRAGEYYHPHPLIDVAIAAYATAGWDFCADMNENPYGQQDRARAAADCVRLAEEGSFARGGLRNEPPTDYDEEIPDTSTVALDELRAVRGLPAPSIAARHATVYWTSVLGDGTTPESLAQWRVLLETVDSFDRSVRDLGEFATRFGRVAA